MKGLYDLCIKIIQVPLKTYLKEIILSLRNIQSLAIELLEIKQNQHLTMTDQLFKIFQTQSLSYPEK